MHHEVRFAEHLVEISQVCVVTGETFLTVLVPKKGRNIMSAGF